MSMLLFLGAFVISFSLKTFRSSSYFPSWVRNILANFGVVLAIIIMTTIDYMSGVNTPKLVVPSSFKPTWEGRNWFVAHAMIVSDHFLLNPWSVVFIAFLVTKYQ